MNDLYISPCKQICQLNHVDKVCKGCGRTIEEITKWPKMTYHERMKVMKRLGYGTRRKKN
jgi:predicted Fe-S protein YdhL (DUF1289 family)